MKKKILITGAGGFIGGHLTNHYQKRGYKIICVDLKKKKNWFQINSKLNNVVADCRDPIVCDRLTRGVDYVFNLACDMGGMGFIENNKALCMLSSVININLLKSAKKNKVKKFLYSSSACIYPSYAQKDYKLPKLKEKDAYPADPEDGYGWEKLFNERMCRHFYEDYGLEVRIARYHNVYGEYGSWRDGREKAPAALARKFAESIHKKKNKIQIWGDGNQIRSFLYIDDCIKGTDLLFKSKFRDPINIGNDKHVTINKLVSILEKITNHKVERIYDTSKPKGVNSRSSDNTLVKKVLNWSPKISTEIGMEKLFNFVNSEYKKMKNEI
ncbi:NAD-dependent epimerase/dehydratase family protein [Candidatus Pelagibacter sp. HIMB1506]|uniref:NAD-dependent epimerase/dehydratase family protein n=1 Tax=Candidatus Pelagibacter sp. HIMB1506 TaxID=3413337 RepID=UPI003F852284